MNLVALLIAATLLGIGAPFMVQLLSTPLRSNTDLTGQTAADAFAERLQIELRRSDGNLTLDDKGVLSLDGNEITAPEGCNFDKNKGATGIFVSCPNAARPQDSPGVAALVTAAPCESDLFPAPCPKP
ncbi:hypothetical protein VB716_07690 [Synechococcus sp. CCY9201]|uniref:hypothetical protein n=1 Tax=Synechococcus sp. CCY9201 TaxID=174697 RepID=UPI002B1FAF52|nr:hypothetical protein [Synechococcus sp. CCY9201]MEA5474104.1 hypothetical protein [Synechococcus sp. CCY9201]